MTKLIQAVLDHHRKGSYNYNTDLAKRSMLDWYYLHRIMILTIKGN